MDKLFTLSALGFYAIALVGMIAHGLKKWVAGEIDGNILDWYRVNPKYTVGVVMAVIGATVSAVIAGGYTDLNNGSEIAACFLAAYALDGLNKQ